MSADWQPIATAPCDDTFVRIKWADGSESIEDLDHDSDPAWWSALGATSWCQVDTWITAHD